MSGDRKETGAARREQILAEARRRERTYRERALKIFPSICARCGREFSGEKLRELTVHHKDHNHDNNPPDGSNWENLCVYCHDHEHGRDDMENGTGELPEDRTDSMTHNPFAKLADMLKDKK